MKIIVSVKANSKKAEVKEISENNFLIRVKSPAKEGKANNEIISLLSGYFKVSKSRIEIIKGLKSNKKIIWIIE